MRLNNFIFLLLTCFAFVLSGCQKGEIPSNDEKYIGVWRNTSGSVDETHTLIIHPNAKAEYSEHTMKGIVSKDNTVSGYIYFDGFNFRVGSKHIGKKFKVDMSPKRITTSVVPYEYYYVAKFNGVDYRKD